MMKQVLFILVAALALTFQADAQKKKTTPVVDSSKLAQSLDSLKSTNQPQQPALLVLKGTAQDFQLLYNIIDRPNKALHTEVVAVEDWITGQINKQLQELADKQKEIKEKEEKEKK